MTEKINKSSIKIIIFNNDLYAHTLGSAVSMGKGSGYTMTSDAYIVFCIAATRGNRALLYLNNILIFQSEYQMDFPFYYSLFVKKGMSVYWDSTGNNCSCNYYLIG